MAEEILTILEQVLNHPVFKAGMIVYIVFAVLVLICVITIFAFVMKQFLEINKRHRRTKRH
jgi:hypothetical protein